jgi:hypothetical protein
MIGAYRKGTREFVLPCSASKSNDETYVCIECSGNLILAKGEKNRPHFRHAVKRDCEYYEHPSESQEHRNGKLTLIELLRSGSTLRIKRQCTLCSEYSDFNVTVSESDRVEEEYRFEHAGPKIADVAVVRADGTCVLFEIFHTHATDDEDRPEPWLEFNARSIRQDVYCIRKAVCEDCWMEDVRAVMRLEEDERDVFDVYPDAETTCVSPWFAERFYEAHLDAVDWYSLCVSRCVPFSFYTRHVESIEWDALCSREGVPLWFYDAHADKLDFERLCEREDIPREFFKKHLERIDLDVLAKARYCKNKSKAFMSLAEDACIVFDVPYNLHESARALGAQCNRGKWWTEIDSSALPLLFKAGFKWRIKEK